MMGHLAAQKDVESLQMSRGRSRCCLDAFLVTSVMFLFLAVAALAAAVVMTQPPRILEKGPAATLVTEERAPSFSIQGQNFAYLQTTQRKLLNCTVTLTERLHRDSRSVGPNFRFGEDTNLLTPLIEGNYFMFVKVNLTCVHRCAAGRLRLDVGDKLSCELLLPVGTDMVSKQCWTVQRLGRKGLQTTMTVFSEQQLENWKLEADTSGVGMFLVD